MWFQKTDFEFKIFFWVSYDMRHLKNTPFFCHFITLYPPLKHYVLGGGKAPRKTNKRVIFWRFLTFFCDVSIGRVFVQKYTLLWKWTFYPNYKIAKNWKKTFFLLILCSIIARIFNFWYFLTEYTSIGVLISFKHTKL